MNVPGLKTFAGWVLGVAIAAAPSVAGATEYEALAITTGVSLGVSAVGYGSFAVGAIALAQGGPDAAVGPVAVGLLPFLIGPPVGAFSSGARARLLGTSPALASGALGCFAAGTGAIFATIASNNVRLQQVLIGSTGVLWAGGTGLTVAQGFRNRSVAKANGERGPRGPSVSVSPWLAPEARGVRVAGRF